MKTLILVPSALEMKHFELEGAWTNETLPRLIQGDVTWAVCGVGPAAAAMTCALHISREKPDRVILAGIAGAFPDSGPELERVVGVASECFADLGYQDAAGYHTLDEMKLPMLVMGERQLGCRYPLEPCCNSLPMYHAVTVSTVTNCVDRALALRDQFGAALENMEGAAVAAACALHGVPCSQIRAISNVVGPRDPKSWRIAPALSALKEFVATHLS